MISEKDEYMINEINFGFPPMKIIMIFSIEYLIAIAFYYFIKSLYVIKSLLPKPPRDIAGDVVVIIGATSTLGKSIAEEFAKRGCSIICIDEDKNLVDQLVLDLRSRYTDLKDNLSGRQITEEESSTNPRVIKAYQCDISNPSEIYDIANNFENEFGGIDILITCINKPHQDIFDTAMTIWKNYYSAIFAFLSSMLNREHVYIVGVTPILSKDVSSSSAIAISNLMECLGEKLSTHLNNCTFFAISPIINKRSIKQSEQRIARDIVEVIRRNQSSLSYGWVSRFLYRASCVLFVIITELTEWYRD